MAKSKNKIQVDWSVYTDRQKATITGYIRHGNKLKAYKEGYTCENQSDKTTKRSCYKFFADPKMKGIVDHIREQAILLANLQIEEAANEFTESLVQEAKDEQLLTVDAMWVLKRAVLLADFNIRKFIKTDDNGNAVFDFSTATDDDWYCIQEYTVEEIAKGKGDDQYFVDKLKIKSVDKLRALEIVGKHVDIQAFRENVGIGGLDGGAVEIADVSDEALTLKLKELGLGGKGGQLGGKRIE